jgi:filamentous hemagglutinin family protein
VSVKVLFLEQTDSPRKVARAVLAVEEGSIDPPMKQQNLIARLEAHAIIFADRVGVHHVVVFLINIYTTELLIKTVIFAIDRWITLKLFVAFLKKHYLVFLFLNIAAIHLATIDCARSQVTADGTLSTTVTTNDEQNFIVNEGEQAGNNLFHSFQEFSVPTNGSVSFNNSSAIANIISRVTGLSPSEINGLIRANGSANLFLINPQGIIFGEGASLDIGGSFVASTAESLVFGDGTKFSAKNNHAKPLLTVSMPIGLQFGQNPATIVDRSQFSISNPSDPTGQNTLKVGLSVQPAKTLALVGGDVILDGGSITAPSGRIEIGSVGSNNFVSLNADAKGWELSYKSIDRLQDIRLDNLASADVSGEGGGDISLRGRRISILGGSGISADTFGSINGGTINVKASELLEIQGSDGSNRVRDPLLARIGIFMPISSRITARTFGQGNGGDIEILTQKLSLLDGARIELQTIENPIDPTQLIGRGGNLSIQAESIDLKGTRPLLGIADSANNIILSTLTLEQAIQINLSSQISSASISNSSSGNIEISTNTLKIEDGSVIGTSPFRSGNGGDIKIHATKSSEILGISTQSGIANSVITANTFARGNAGNIQITTSQLTLKDGGAIITSTSSTGRGGNITINASAIDITGISNNARNPFTLNSETLGEGNAGNIFIDTENLNIRDGATLTVRGTSSGSPGNLEVFANSLKLDDRANITATTASGQGGDIKLEIDELLQLGNNSSISALAEGNGNGGNIKINSGFIIAFPRENSDIIASSNSGNGGRIDITTKGIFGIEQRDRTTSLSDITASSEFGIDGIVKINTPEVNPSQKLSKLPTEVIDATQIIEQNLCAVGLDNAFIITGRGGLPSSPDRVLRDDYIWEDWRLEDSTGVGESNLRIREKSLNLQTKTIFPLPIIEAQGWIVNSDGKIILTAETFAIEPKPFNSVVSGCQFNRLNVRKKLGVAEKAMLFQVK